MLGLRRCVAIPGASLQHCILGCTIVLIVLDVVIFSMVVFDGWAGDIESLASFTRHREGFMADRARNQHGLGKAVTFNVITPMTRVGAWVVGLALWFFDRAKWTQNTARGLAFLPFVHWVSSSAIAFRGWMAITRRKS